MKDLLERAALIASATAAILVASVLVKREVFPPKATDVTVPVTVKNWEAFDRGGQVTGEGPTTLIVFSDYQCPACRLLDESIQAVLSQSPPRLRVRYRHYPLEQTHANARTLARGAECAAQVHRFDAFHRAVFAAQDSLETLPVLASLGRSGIKDTAAFQACISAEMTDARIDADKAAGDSLGLRATPTFLLGGIRYVGAISPRRLDSLLAKIESR